MRKYIFLTDEGYTYQPNSMSNEPDCENSQMLGIIEAENEEKAFKRLINENKYLKLSTFSNVYCYELTNNTVKKNLLYKRGFYE